MVANDKRTFDGIPHLRQANSKKSHRRSEMHSSKKVPFSAHARCFSFKGKKACTFSLSLFTVIIPNPLLIRKFFPVRLRLGGTTKKGTF